MDAGDEPEAVSDYGIEEYSDPLERALVEASVEELAVRPFVGVSPETTVGEALAALARHDVACVMVAEAECLVGIFTEQDVLRKVALELDRLKDRPVRELMSPNPTFVYRSDSAADALCVMSACGYRHVPVLDERGRITGIVSPRRLIAFLRHRVEAASSA